MEVEHEVTLGFRQLSTNLEVTALDVKFLLQDIANDGFNVVQDHLSRRIVLAIEILTKNWPSDNVIQSLRLRYPQCLDRGSERSSTRRGNDEREHLVPN